MLIICPTELVYDLGAKGIVVYVSCTVNGERFLLETEIASHKYVHI